MALLLRLDDQTWTQGSIRRYGDDADVAVETGAADGAATPEVPAERKAQSAFERSSN